MQFPLHVVVVVVVVVVLLRAASRISPNSLPLNHSRSTDVRNATVQEGMKGNRSGINVMRVEWRRSSVPVHYFRNGAREGVKYWKQDFDSYEGDPG